MSTKALTTQSIGGGSGLVQIKVLSPTVIDGQNVPAGTVVTVDVNQALLLTGGTNPLAALVSPLPAPQPPPPATETGELAPFPPDSKAAQAQAQVTAASTAAWNKSMAQQAAANAAAASASTSTSTT